MKTSINGIELIKHFEDLRLESYDDGTGVWTIGWGHTGDVEPGQHINEACAEHLLTVDIIEAERIVNSFGNLGIALYGKQQHFDALVSLAFNCGNRPFRKGTGLHDALERGSLEEVPAQILRWNRADGKVLPDLVRRRQAEARLWQRGEWREPEPARPTLRRGDRGEEVKRLQRLLNGTGRAPLVEDGIFGRKTEATLKDFQWEHGLSQTGEMDEATWAALAGKEGEE